MTKPTTIIMINLPIYRTGFEHAPQMYAFVSLPGLQDQ